MGEFLKVDYKEKLKKQIKTRNMLGNRNLKELYDLWYEKQEELTSIYKTVMPERMPLSRNPEFKTIRNAVIKAASEYEILNDSEQDEDIVGVGLDDGSKALKIEQVTEALLPRVK